jgi:hypothetical protein
MSEMNVVDAIAPTPLGSTELALVPDSRDFGGYAGVATVELMPDKKTKLLEPFEDEAYDILPTGEVYVSQVHYRRRLNEVFGPGSWALVPRGRFAMEGNTITREYALVGPGGRFISEAIGEAEYQPTNDRMTYASACEACKSNALTRCCKDLGIASECWDKRFCERFKGEKCGQFFRNQSRGKPQWRRLDASPFYDEGNRVDKAASRPPRAAADPSEPPIDEPDWVKAPSRSQQAPAEAAKPAARAHGGPGELAEAIMQRTNSETEAKAMLKQACGAESFKGLKGETLAKAWAYLDALDERAPGQEG